MLAQNFAKIDLDTFNNNKLAQATKGNTCNNKAKNQYTTTCMY